MDAKQKELTLRITEAIYETACETADGPYGGVPEGHAYAALGNLVNLDSFQAIVHVLKKIGAVTVKGHLIKAIDPKRSLSDILESRTA